MATEGAPDSGKASPVTARDERPLTESLDDASVLLWYATREGKTFPDGTVKTIVDAQHRLAGGARDPEVESAFWLAFRNLAVTVHPISVDSILATYSYPFGVQKERRTFGDAMATKRKYSIAAVFVLICLLLVQVYWYVGDTFRHDLESHREELDRISGSLRQMRFESSNLAALIQIKEEQVRQAVAGASANLGDLDAVNKVRSTVEVLTADIERLKSDRDRNEVDFENLDHRSRRVNIVLEGDKKLLDWWDFFTELTGIDLMAGMSLAGTDAAGGAAGAPSASNVSAYSAASSESAADRASGNFSDRLKAEEARLIDGQLKVEMSLLSSKSVLAILNQYLLPLLYGLLGSLAYILRTLSTEIQNVTFTRGSDIRYSLRWPLGMLGGVTVGLFFDPAELTGLAAITPLGLAFLAGYGVELVFTGLDRLVRAFTGEEHERAAPPARP